MYYGKTLLRRVIETLGELNIIRQTNAPKQCLTKYIAVNSVRHTTYFTRIKQKSLKSKLWRLSLYTFYHRKRGFLKLITDNISNYSFCGSCESSNCLDFIFSYIFLGFLAGPYIFCAGSICTHTLNLRDFPHQRWGDGY